MGQNFLCHTSQKTTEHARVAMLIRNYLNRVSDDLEAGGSDTETMMVCIGLRRVARTMTEPPPFDDVLERIKKRLPRRECLS
jgi:hypothetical protein